MLKHPKLNLTKNRASMKCEYGKFVVRTGYPQDLELTPISLLIITLLICAFNSFTTIGKLEMESDYVNGTSIMAADQYANHH